MAITALDLTVRNDKRISLVIQNPISLSTDVQSKNCFINNAID